MAYNYSTVLTASIGAMELEFAVTVVYERNPGCAETRDDPGEAASVEIVDIILDKTPERRAMSMSSTIADFFMDNPALHHDLMEHWANDEETRAEQAADARNDARDEERMLRNGF